MDPTKVSAILDITTTITRQPPQHVLEALALHKKCDLVAALVATTLRSGSLNTGSLQVAASSQVSATGGTGIRSGSSSEDCDDCKDCDGCDDCGDCNDCNGRQ